MIANCLRIIAFRQDNLNCPYLSSSLYEGSGSKTDSIYTGGAEGEESPPSLPKVYATHAHRALIVFTEGWWLYSNLKDTVDNLELVLVVSAKIIYPIAWREASSLMVKLHQIAFAVDSCIWDAHTYSYTNAIIATRTAVPWCFQ